jgi:hypothetical protein
MNIQPYGNEIAITVNDSRANASKVQLLFDRYTSLGGAREKEAFVLALIGELMVTHARQG